MFSIERSRSTRKAGILTLLGVLLVPLLVAGGFLAATYQSQDRLARVQAAVVNLDDPVRLNGQLVPLGRQLAGGLVNGSDDIHHQSTTNFAWVLSDRADAAAGLAAGTYAAVVTIPKSFSADATSYSKASSPGKGADDAQHATLDVQTSAVAGVTDPAVAQAISTAAVSTLNSTLTKSYLENVYLGFNDTKKQFTTVADGAGKLADGATQLAAGIDQTSTGTGKLADGMHQLSDGASQLAGGVSSLDTGTGQLADGLGQAATGGKKLAVGGTKLDAGLKTYATGMKTYAGGVKSYAAGTRTYAAGVKTFAGKGSQLAGGASQYAAGVKTAYGSLQTVTDTQLTAVCAQAQISTAQCAAVKQAMAAIHTGVFEGDGSARNPGLIAGAEGLSSGVTQYTAGATKLVGGASRLAGGASRLSSGAATLSGGAAKLSAGLHSYTGGVSTLSTGIGQSATGAKKLAAGVTELDSGASQLAIGVSKSANGVDQLDTGVIKLAAGGDKLADGTTKLADGLAKGAKQIPTYTKSDRTTLASVVAAPVSSERPDTLFSDVTTTTLLALLALWLGGLVSYLVVRVVPSGVLGSATSSVRLALEALAPGAAIAVVQAVVFSVVLQRLLHLSAGDFGATLGFLTFAAVTFAVVNHALAAWFGGFGRFVSAVAMAVVAAAALTSAVPGAIDSLRAVLPLTPGLEGLRAIVTGASGTGHAVGILLAWLVVGAVASVVAVARRRMLPAHADLTPALV